VPARKRQLALPVPPAAPAVDEERPRALTTSTRQAPAVVSAVGDAANSPEASGGIDPAVRRWMPLVVPLMGLLVCSMVAMIWLTML